MGRKGTPFPHLQFMAQSVPASYCYNDRECTQPWTSSSWAHWKARSGLPISDNWTFSQCVTAESPRAIIGSKSTISLQRRNKGYWTAFLSHPLGGGLRDNVWCSSLTHWKARIIDFLLVFSGLFSIDVTAEALRAKTDRKLAISLQSGQFDQKFQVEGDVPHQLFLHG